jgi:ATP-dependent DNA helicase RecG
LPEKALFLHNAFFYLYALSYFGLRACWLIFLKTPIEFLKGVGPQRAELLKKELQLFTFEDLLHFYPFRYIDKSRFYKIREITEDMPYVQIRGIHQQHPAAWWKRTTRMTALLTDDQGSYNWS